MGVLTIEERVNKVKDALQSVAVELQSAPLWSVELMMELGKKVFLIRCSAILYYHN